MQLLSHLCVRASAIQRTGHAGLAAVGTAIATANAGAFGTDVLQKHAESGRNNWVSEEICL
jgi:hypothetical protein